MLVYYNLGMLYREALTPMTLLLLVRHRMISEKYRGRSNMTTKLEIGMM